MSKRNAHLPLPPRLVLTHLTEDEAGVLSRSHPFLWMRRFSLEIVYTDGTKSAPFVYDCVERKSLHSVVIVAYFYKDGVPFVFLRSSLRPPIALQMQYEEPNLWEIPGGLIDEGESPVEAAARELEEEMGFRMPVLAFQELGPPTWAVPATIAEHNYYYAVQVDPTEQRPPSGDGSPLEHGAMILAVSAQTTLQACALGSLPDLKTELALRRFMERI